MDNFPLRFHDLMEAIRSAGIQVSPSQMLDIQKILYLAEDMSTESVADLIAPIIASNAKEQEMISKICKAFFVHSFGLKQQPLPAPRRTKRTARQQWELIYKNIWRLWNNKKHRYFIIGGFILLIIFIRMLGSSAKGSPSGPIVYSSPAALVYDQPIHFVVSNYKGSGTVTVQWVFNSGADTIRDSARIQDTVIHNFKDTSGNLYVSAAIYDSGQYISTISSTLAPQPAGDTNDHNAIYSWVLIVFSVVIAVLAILFIILYRYYFKKRQVVKTITQNIRVDNDRYKELPVKVEFPKHMNFLDDDAKVKKIVMGMLKKEETEIEYIDIRSSIVKTSRNAGVPSIVKLCRTRSKEFIAIIQSKGENDHLYHLFDGLIDKLISQGVFIEKYYYTDRPDNLVDQRGLAVKLEILTKRKLHCNFLIMGEGREFLDLPEGGFKARFIPLFQHIAHKFLVTPFATEEWGYGEAQFSQQGFMVIPAVSEAIILLNEFGKAGRATLERKLAELKYSPYKSASFNSVAGIRDYLDNELIFQLLCSLAVYPRLTWPLTVQLSYAMAELINKNDALPGKLTIDYDLFLTLSRISWLRRGILTDGLRLALLQELRPELQIAVRKNILRLLGVVRLHLNEHAIANIELEIQKTINSFALFVYDRKEFESLQGSVKEISHQWYSIGDWAFLQYADELPSARTGEDEKLIKVEDYIFPDRKKLFRRMTIMAACLGGGIILFTLILQGQLSKSLPASLTYYNPPASNPASESAATDSTSVPADTTKSVADSTTKADTTRKKVDSTKK